MIGLWPYYKEKKDLSSLSLSPPLTKPPCENTMSRLLYSSQEERESSLGLILNFQPPEL